VATPEKLTRLYMMRDMPTVRRGVLLALVAATGINLLVFVLALAAIPLFPALPTGDLAMPMVALAVLPPVAGAVLLAALTSAMMSTVDSLLLVAGSALAHDLYQGLVDPGASPRRKAVLNRVAIVVVGSVPAGLLLSGVGEGELVQFIVLLFTALMASSFFAPVVVGVLWRGATAAGAIAAMLGGVTAAASWKALGSGVVDPVLPGIAVSALLFFFVSRFSRPPSDAGVAAWFGDSEVTR
jgi:Na+/pantothenate symporter